ncbi:MAG: tetratricopeptide repeat protein [Candidatus Aminicenantes bacterium]|nr:tetratricopeptide repeat protein [Candidatus Aminicenantes bacterium]
MVLDIKRLLEIDAIAKAMEGPGIKKAYDEFVKMSGIDPKKDVAYVGWGIPAAAIAARLSMPTSPVPFKDFAMVVGLTSDKSRIQGLVKEKVPEAKQKVYNGVAIFSLVDESEPAAATPGVPAGLGAMTFRLAFLDDTHIVLGDDSGVKGAIDVYQKRAEPLAKVPEMAAFMSRVDKSGIAWSAVVYPPEQAKMIAGSNPLLKAIEGFKGIILAIDDKDSTLIVDIRTLGGTPEQNAAFATNLSGLKSVGALYAAEQPALGELLNGIVITSGGDYTRLTVTVSHETVGKLWRLVEPKGAEWMALSVEAEALFRKGDYERALEVGKHALEVAEKNVGPDHLDVAALLNNLGRFHGVQRQYAEAELLLKRSLAIREKALGPDHRDVAESLTFIALLDTAQGRPAEAEPLLERSLAIREKALGTDDPDVAESLDNLAFLYGDQDRYAEAEPLFKRSLAIREKTLGPDNSDVAKSLDNLAFLYRDQGRYAEAEPLFKRSLAIREKAFGPDHPDIATVLDDLAHTYYYQRQYAKAEPLWTRLLAIREKALSPDDPDVAESLKDLAMLFHIQGQYAKAEPLYKRSLAIREKALGPDDPDVAESLSLLAELYRATKREKEAKELEARAARIQSIKR